MIVQSINRSRFGVVIWLLVAGVVFGVSVAVGYWGATQQGSPQLIVENKQGLYTPEVSNEGLSEYLHYAGLSDMVERVVLMYEPEKLPTVAYTRELPNATLDVMMNLKVDEGEVRVWLYYNPELFGQMLATPKRLEADLLAGICLALNPGTMPSCYEQAFRYIEWTKEAGIPAVIQPASQQSWWQRLVPQAYAGCSGTIPCGADRTVCSCPNSSTESCSANNESCQTGGKCFCQTTCDTTQNNLQCSALG